MSKDTPNSTNKHSTTSALDKFTLSLEYNVSWADEKKTIKHRTI